MSKQVRKSISADQLRVWRDYIETAEVLASALSSRMQSDSSLSTGDYRVLLALSEADGRMLRSSDLAGAMGWERSRLSHHLGRMEKRALIGREKCADDNRGSNVTLTKEGAVAFRRGSVPHFRAVKELFLDALSAEQLGHLDAVTGAIRAHLGNAD